MIRALRIVLEAVLFFLLLAVVLAVGSGNTGTVETVVLVAVGLALVWLATRVRHLGPPAQGA